MLFAPSPLMALKNLKGVKMGNNMAGGFQNLHLHGVNLYFYYCLSLCAIIFKITTNNPM